MSKYIGRRIVPIHCGAWDQSKPYEMLSIVLEENSGDSYISRRAVPAGTAITDENFWSLHSLFSQQIRDMSDQLATAEQRIREDNDATEAAIRADNDATEQAIRENNAETIQTVEASLAQTEQTLTETVTAAQTAMTRQKNSFDSTAAALNDRMDTVLAAGTGDGATEVADARVDADGTSHASLGTAFRTVQSGSRQELVNAIRGLPFMVNVHNGKFVNWRESFLETLNSACYTDKVPCKKGDVFHVRSNAYMNAAAAVLYHDKTIVTHYGDDTYAHGGTVQTYDITIPESVNWIQFSAINRSLGFSVTRESEDSIGCVADIQKSITETRSVADDNRLILDDVVARSVNLFDKNDPRNIEGKYWNQGGQVIPLDRAGLSHPIRIRKGVKYKWTVRTDFWGGNSTGNCLTDADGNYLSYIEGTLSEDGKTVTYTAKAEGYIRIKLYLPGINSAMFCREDAWPAAYTPFSVSMKYTDLSGYAKISDLSYYAELGQLDSVLRNRLYGKVAVFDGDSIAAGNSTDGNWAKVIGEANNMDWHNESVGGGTITAEMYVESSGAARHWVSRNIDGIHSRYPTLDYLILEGGTNDADLLASQISTKFGELNLADYSGSYDDTTFTGALDSLFFKATRYYPTARIGFIVAQKMGTSSSGYGPTNNRRKFFLRAIEVCKKWGIPYLDLWEGSPLNPRLACYYDSSLSTTENRAAGKAYYDGQHLTGVGYAIASAKIEAWMRTL